MKNSREQARYVQGMFARVAPRYDLMNFLMTAGQHRVWIREVIRSAGLRPGSSILDLGSGTGDLAREALRAQPGCSVVAGDFTLEMMLAGRDRGGAQPHWAATDALSLPFAEASFDVLVSGYLLRNVTDLELALREQYRVLKPGGIWLALDTTRPRPSILTPFIQFHMRRVIPLMGALVTGQRDAYTYLPTTSENFLLAETLAERVQAAGFKQVSFARRMFGTIAIHRAVR